MCPKNAGKMTQFDFFLLQTLKNVEDTGIKKQIFRIGKKSP